MIKLKDFDIDNDTEFNFFTHLYNISFPKKERRSISNIYYLLHNNKKYTAKLVVANENELVGLLCYWTFDDFIFAEHLAVDNTKRSRGIGTKIMQLFLDQIDRPLILEIELPETEISKRRLEFYKRVGFRYWGNIEYIQPAYHATTPPVPMKLLTMGDIDLEGKYDSIKRRIYKGVYKIQEEY